ncbi:MAG: PadR family transcriptional regulator [Bacteroidetes bacterium 43-16]|nr:MAG: PadR family transcriptional regulator [Bacteroidetes bacterium 43-16]
MNIDNAQSQMRKGVLEYCILAIIKDREVYPSEILEQMKMSGLNILEGTLYPLLTRLKNAGLLTYRWEESTSGPPRKYFSLTEDGDQFYVALDDTWTQMSTAVNNIINANA